MSPALKTPLLLAALAAYAPLLGCQGPVSPAAVLAEDEYGITGIALDEFDVYFTRQEGLVKRVSLDGGPTEEVASNITDPRHIAVDTTHVYWATSTGTIARALKTGGDPEILAEGIPDLRDMVLDNAAVYFTSEQGRSVNRLEKDGSAPEVLLEDEENPPGALAQSGGILYWGTAREQATIEKMVATGGTVTPLVGGQGNVESVSADPSYVYWTTPGIGTIRRVRPDGSDLVTVAVEQPLLYKVLGDTKNVFWSSLDGSISTAPADGKTEPFILSRGPEGPTFIAQDEGFLYSARYASGTILVRPKAEDLTE